jgi:hypothetical protein
MMTLVSILFASVGASGVTVGSLSTKSKGVEGNVVVKTDATGVISIELQNFSYDGFAPDAFFMIGNGSGSPNIEDAFGLYGEVESRDQIRPNQLNDSSIEPLEGSYSGDTVKLELDTTVEQLKWISVYCRLFKEDFGSFKFPATCTKDEECSTGKCVIDIGFCATCTDNDDCVFGEQCQDSFCIIP